MSIVAFSSPTLFFPPVQRSLRPIIALRAILLRLRTFGTVARLREAGAGL
jgi:hypothetical protein